MGELIWVPADIPYGIDMPPAQANGNHETESDSWTPINLAELAEHPPVQPTLSTTGLVYPGKRHVFSGPQESAKTLAAYAIGIDIARTGRTVILIDFEMGSWEARNRLRELGATSDELTRMPYLEPHEPATAERIARLLELDPALVIIDAAAGAYDLQGLDENKRGDVERLARLYTRSFFRAGIATITLDHVVKNTETRGKYAIGSERKTGGADVHLGFETITPIARGKTGLYKIVTHKDRGGFLHRGKLADLELASDPDTHHITWTFRPAEETTDDPDWQPTKLMEKISQYLERHEEPRSRNQVESDVIGKRDYMRRAIDALVALGHVEETSGPRGAKLLKSVSRYVVQHPETDLAPTSPHLAPGRSQSTSPHLAPPLQGATVEEGELAKSNQLDLAPADEDPDRDIPW